jgi:hypothetical protein
MGTRENSIATWCKRFQIDLWKLRDRGASLPNSRATVRLRPTIATRAQPTATLPSRFFSPTCVGFGRRPFLVSLSKAGLLADLRSEPKFGRYRFNIPHGAGKLCPSLCHRSQRPTCFLVARINRSSGEIDRPSSAKIEVVLHGKLMPPGCRLGFNSPM